MRQLSKKKIIAIVLLLLVVIGLPLAVFLLQQRQDIRQRASNNGSALLTLSTPARQVGSGAETDLTVTGTSGVDISAFDITFQADGSLTFPATDAYTLPSGTTFEIALSEVSANGKDLHVIIANPTATPFTGGALGTLHLNAAGAGSGTIKIIQPTTAIGGGSTTIDIDPITFSTPPITYAPPVTNTPTPAPLAAPIPDTGGLCLNSGETADGQTFNFVWNDPRAVLIEISTNNFGNDGTGQPANWVTKRISGSTNTNGAGFSSTDIPVFTYTLGVRYSVRLATDNNAQVGDSVTFGVNQCAAPTLTPVPTATATPIPTDTPIPTATPTHTPIPTQISGSPTVTGATGTGNNYLVQLGFPLRGIPTNNGAKPTPTPVAPLTPTRNIVVCLYPLTFDTATDPLCQSQQATVINGTVTYDAGLRQFVNNTFNLAVPANTYQFLVKADRYLRTKLSNNLVLPATPDSTAIQVNTITPLIAGDVNGDNEINITDWNILRDCGALAAKNPPSMAASTASDPYKSKACQDHVTKGMGSNPAYENADLNNDGFVNTFDYQQFSFGISSIKGS